MSPLYVAWSVWYCGLVALVALVLLAVRRWNIRTRLVGVAAVAGWSYASWRLALELVRSTAASGYHFNITGEPLEWPTAQAGLAAGIFLAPVILTPFILAVRAELRQMDAEARQAANRDAGKMVSIVDASSVKAKANGAERNGVEPRPAETSAKLELPSH